MTVIDELANVRTGDKGDTLILAVFPRDDWSFHQVDAYLTADVVARHYGVSDSSVTRRVVETIQGLVFELQGILGGGVTGSPVLDGHGKTLSYHLLTLDVPASPEGSRDAQGTLR